MKDEKETRVRLLASAKAEFLEKGYMQASLRNICKNVGVTTGALYFFFEDKEDLFASLVEEPLHGVYGIMKAHYAEELRQLQSQQPLQTQQSPSQPQPQQLQQPQPQQLQQPQPTQPQQLQQPQPTQPRPDADRMKTQGPVDDIAAAKEAIHYMYLYYDEFQLLLTKAQGSRFEQCVDQFVDISEKHYRAMADRYTELFGGKRVGDNMIHWMAHMQIDMFVHMLTHEESEEEALSCMENAVKFMTAGWLGMFHA